MPKRVFILDTGIVSAIVRDKLNTEQRRIQAWFLEVIIAEHTLVMPAMVYHESLRGLLHAERAYGYRAQLQRFYDLEAFGVERLTLTDAILDDAADLWAELLREGKPTSDQRKRYDGDTIIAAEVRAWTRSARRDAIVATKNVEHLARFEGVAARHPDDIDV